MEIKKPNRFSLFSMLIRSLYVWLTTNLLGTVILMIGAKIRGGFEQPGMIAGLGVYIASVSLPAIVLFPAFFYWLMRVRQRSIRIPFVFLFAFLVHFISVYLACGIDTPLTKVIRNAALLFPYALSAAGSMLFFARDIVLQKEVTGYNDSFQESQ